MRLLLGLLLGLTCSLCCVYAGCVTAYSNTDCSASLASACSCVSTGTDPGFSTKFVCHSDRLTGDLQTFSDNHCNGTMVSQRSFPIDICIRSTLYTCPSR
eukprot:m.13843 g.13843  ORF g.13843 m.13843 type:complete len:100 (-) comp10229_c0_seq1:286-585(-)